MHQKHRHAGMRGAISPTKRLHIDDVGLITAVNGRLKSNWRVCTSGPAGGRSLRQSTSKIGVRRTEMQQIVERRVEHQSIICGLFPDCMKQSSPAVPVGTLVWVNVDNSRVHNRHRSPSQRTHRTALTVQHGSGEAPRKVSRRPNLSFAGSY